MLSERTGGAEPYVPTSAERRAHRNGRNFALWACVFTASFLIGNFVFVKNGWFPDGALGIALSLVPMIPGGIAFAAFLKLFRENDEIGRKAMTEGMVFALGAVIIFWGSIQLPEHVWLPKISADQVITVLMFGFAFGMVRASWRYK